MRPQYPRLTQMGAKIKKARRRKGLRLCDVGPMVGLSDRALSLIENGRSSARILNLLTIADVLGVDVKEFL